MSQAQARERLREEIAKVDEMLTYSKNLKDFTHTMHTWCYEYFECIGDLNNTDEVVQMRRERLFIAIDELHKLVLEQVERKEALTDLISRE